MCVCVCLCVSVCVCVFMCVCASAPEWMFVYMGERGWQGYNLLQTACGQRRGGRDSDTEREQGMERVRGGEERGGRKRRGGASKGKKWVGREGRNTDRKEKTRREGGELRAEWIGAAYECSTVPTVLFPLPPIVIPGSVGASEAANSSDIYAAFSALQWRKPGPQPLSAPTMASGRREMVDGKRRWTAQP